MVTGDQLYCFGDVVRENILAEYIQAKLFSSRKLEMAGRKKVIKSV